MSFVYLLKNGSERRGRCKQEFLRRLDRETKKDSHFSQPFPTDQLRFPDEDIAKLSKTELIRICINIKKDERNIAVQVC